MELCKYTFDFETTDHTQTLTFYCLSNNPDIKHYACKNKFAKDQVPKYFSQIFSNVCKQVQNKQL